MVEVEVVSDFLFLITARGAHEMWRGNMIYDGSEVIGLAD